jgi:PAS domain S-box-containing protein
MTITAKGLHAKLKELERVNQQLRDELARAAARTHPISTAMQPGVADELRIANRALRAISDCNQALMRSADEDELLSAVCRVVVQAGYRYAWVGYAEQDSAQSIRPVAQAGFEPGFLDDMRISWADSERGQGSTAMAIRHARAYVMQDLQNNPQFAPWRAYAVQLGQQAAVSLPLFEADRVFGALTIYAADPHAFNTTETALLTELAGDLAYGIVATRTRAALQRSELRLLLALDAAHLGMWDWNLVHDEVIWSPQYAVIFGFTPQSAPRSYADFEARLHPDDRAALLAAIARARDARGTFNHEYRVVWPDGTVRWVHGRGQCLYDAQGKAVRMLGVVADITAQRKLEEQQRQSQKLEAIGTLASGIAHDFNNILSAIVGNIELAQQDLAANHPASISLGEISKASRRGRDVVRQILAFSRPEIQQRSRLALGTVILEAAKLLRAIVPAGIDLRSTIQPQCPDVYADATQVHQVLVNLCTNAWHAIAARDDNGGRIDIDLDCVQAGDTGVAESLPSGCYLRVAVSDNGIGMDEATLQRMFEPFFTTKSNAQGSGLGLAVVHGIVRSHSGAIFAHSKVNTGTRFEVYFPALAPHAADEPAVRATGVPRGAGQRILYIDDDEALVFLGMRVLERLGYQVQGFAQPAAALAAFGRAAATFDLIVTDLNMPGMSGLELVRAVRALRADIPVVLTSGYIDQALQQQAQDCNVTRVVYKPNSMDELGKLIHEIVLELQGADAATQAPLL